MYDFRETTPFTGADDNQLPAEAMLIDGQYIENLVPGYRTLQVGGRELLKQSATSNVIGISDGETLEYVRNPSREITVGYQLIADDDDAFRTAFYKLSGILHGDTHQVSFNDDLSVYWNAVLTDVDDVPKGRNAITSSFTLFVPDGVAHSVATKTFDNMPYKDIPLNLMAGTSADPVSVTGSGWNIKEIGSYNNPVVGQKYAATVLLGRADFAVSFQLWANDINGNRISLDGFPVTAQMGANQRRTIVCTWPDPGTTGAAQIEVTLAWAFQKTDVGTYQYLKAKLEEGTTYSTWSPNPADPEYYSNTITVHNGGTYPVEPVITATMHADNGMVGIVNDRPGILQFGTQEIDGFTTEESEVALNLAAVQGSHMDNQAATNNPYWGGDPSMPNEQIGNSIWTHDDYDGWKVEPNWTSITGDHKYWNGPSIKHNLVQTHNGNFKSNLTWDVMTRFQTGVAQVGALETTLESDGKPIFQMILKDNSALSDQLWWMCYYKDQLVVNEQLDRSIFTNEKFIQLELQKFSNSVVFRVSPWIGNQGRETTITRQFTFADAADVETKQFSTWFMRDKTWGESTMYLIASTVKWQNVSWYTNIKNRFSDGDVLKIDVANAKTYLNGSLDPTMHTLGNQWEQFELPPGDTEITITPSSWAQPFACEVEIREAWL
ncbi:MAG: phage tail family protein [Lacticaseibacillus paracasei]|nr:phage tail family protein [Lacticaseibacillus paracasei]MCH4042456.1 phage tail family protein [Lacticaseibacillus paracasei]MCH4117846.1 phage tail family protein [Lacticaseibacillus paracasei]MCH4145563.1 phage tail family protein [Lacticaseibacillus paracasei]MCI1338118.1 phage tail family protein [Lacticaseibacillus paracasei]